MLHCGNAASGNLTCSPGPVHGWNALFSMVAAAANAHFCSAQLWFRSRTMLINLFVAARNAFATWQRRQRAYGELMALDDRSLADIGIRRSEIPAVVEG